MNRFARLIPLIRRNRATLAVGAVALLLANFLDVQVLVLLGRGIDLLGWEMGPVSGAKPGILGAVLATIVCVAMAGAMARFWMRRLIIGVSRHIEFDLRNDLFAHLQKMSPSFYQKYPTGDLMARATNDLEAVRLVVGPAVMYVCSTGVMLPMSVYQMIRISPSLTLISCLPLLLIVPLFYFFSSRIHRRFMVVQETYSAISTRVQEALTGVRVIKAYAREDSEAGRFEKLSEQFVDENVRLTLLQALFIPMLGFVVGSTLLALIWAGSTMITRGAGVAGGLTQGHLISFFLLLMANIWPLAAIGWVFSLFERGSASMKRIDELFEASPDVVDSDNVPVRVEKMLGRIEVHDLTFTYPGAERPALRDLDVTVPAGRTLGLTGPVGSGKSTLAQILARRYNPPRVSVLVDGVDLLDWPLAEYRSQVGIVDQEPFVFSDTIRANILYAVPDSTNGTAESMAGIAQLAKDVERLPGSYETMLGERGINLSGGQRQRAALARAIAADPEILILDDALAAVDTHTEEEILRGLAKVMRDRTTLLISHRIRTVSIADHILYLEDGCVVEQGTHAELLSMGGRYAALARKQQLAEEIEATA